MFENFDWMGAMRTSPVMVVILVCSVVTFGFTIERVLYFWNRRANPEDLHRQLTDKVRADELRGLGLEQSRLFDWNRTAEATIAFYRRILGA